MVNDSCQDKLEYLMRANTYIITCLETINVSLEHSPLFYLSSRQNLNCDQNFIKLLAYMFIDAIELIVSNDVEERVMTTDRAQGIRKELIEEVMSQVNMHPRRI